MKTVELPCIRCGKPVAMSAWRAANPKHRKKTCSAKCCYQRNGSLEERFWAKVDRRGPNECWEWTANTKTAKEKYGRFWATYPNGKMEMRYAHRVSWEIHNGPAPKGLVIRHHCDNPKCVNPAHLGTGTWQDNSRDALKRGRMVGVAKLTPDKVRTIREMLGPEKKDWATYRRIANRYGLTPSAIFHLHVRRSWKWVA